MTSDRNELLLQVAHGVTQAVNDAGSRGAPILGRRYDVDAPPTPKYYDEDFAPGVELNNYLKRTPSSDETYVVVVDHSEHVEKIRQPPTPEEIAEKKEADNRRLKILAGTGAFLLGVLSLFAWSESKRPRQSTGGGVSETVS